MVMFHSAMFDRGWNHIQWMSNGCPMTTENPIDELQLGSKHLGQLSSKVVPSGKRLHNYGSNPPISMGKSTISMAIFHSFLLMFGMGRVHRKCDAWFNVAEHRGVAWNGATPKSSILVRFSNTYHPFWGTSIYGNPRIRIVSFPRKLVIFHSHVSLQDLLENHPYGYILPQISWNNHNFSQCGAHQWWLLVYRHQLSIVICVP